MSRFDPLVRSAEDEEIRHHLAECVDELIEQGWTPDAARTEAERRFGDLGRVRRELSWLALWSRLTTALELALGDVRYALRGLWLNRTFTLAVIATLGLGIGALSSIFAVADAALLRPLAFAEADRWEEIWGVTKAGGRGQPGLPVDRVSRWRETSSGLFDGWVVSMPGSVVRTDGGRAQRLDALAITPGAERLLGIPMLLGRGFTADDARPGAPGVAILRRGYWEKLGADRGIVGSTIATSAGPVTVVGVLDTDLRVPLRFSPQDLWIPIRTDFTALDQKVRLIQWVWARRADGVSHSEAQDRVGALAVGFATENPATNWRIELDPLGTLRFNEQLRRAIGVLGAMVGAIYLIALLNGVNLLLVRRAARARELELRASLGASSIRILRQLLTEGLVLGCLGGAAALAIARLSIREIARHVPQDFASESPFTISMEGRTLWFIAGSTLVAGVLLGLIPGIGLRRGSSARGGRPSPGGESRSARRAHQALVTTQVALSTLLLIGAVLLGTSLSRLLHVDTGFDDERVAFANMNLAPPRYPDANSRTDMIRRLRAGLGAYPEVSGLSVYTSSISFGEQLEAEGLPIPSAQPDRVPFRVVDSDYFKVTGTRLVSGRGFQPDDAGGVYAVIDRDLARFLWDASDPIGRRFRLGPQQPWYEVVGVADQLRLDGRDDRKEPYQFLVAGKADAITAFIQLVVRTEGPSVRLLPAMERALWSVDPEQTFFQLATADQVLAIQEDQPRFLAGLVAGLASLAVVLAAIGLYGVLAYAVARRSREIGIRIAIGARPAGVRGSVLGEGIAMAVIGAALGLAAAFAASRVLAPFLFDVQPRDPRLFALTAIILVAVAVVASFIPAQRATRVDPMQVLRAD